MPILRTWTTFANDQSLTCQIPANQAVRDGRARAVGSVREWALGRSLNEIWPSREVGASREVILNHRRVSNCWGRRSVIGCEYVRSMGELACRQRGSFAVLEAAVARRFAYLRM
jgi:hypothetical protein